MTVRDFMNYLIYVEHSAENLQFYLWYQDYVKRFNAAPAADISLSPEWTQAMEDEAVARIRRDQVEKIKPDMQVAQIFKGTNFEKMMPDMPTPETAANPFNTPPRSSNGEGDGSVFSSSRTMLSSTHAANYKVRAADCFQSAGAKLPCEYSSSHCAMPTLFVSTQLLDVSVPAWPSPPHSHSRD